MFMMCIFYCIPLAKGLFIASGPLLILFSMFMLKRGIRRLRGSLRQLAFVCFIIAFTKIFIVDAYLARGYLACVIFKSCTQNGVKAVQGGALLLLAISCAFLLNLYRGFAHDKPQKHVTPEQAHLRFWGNLSLLLVFVLMFWLAAPWVGFLTVGHVPQFVMSFPWHGLAVLNIAVLLRGFWKLEDCSWTFDAAQKDRGKHQHGVWTAKDTLWVSVILFVITLGFSYASNDVLSSAMPTPGGHMEFLEGMDIEKINHAPLAQPFEAPPAPSAPAGR